MKIEHSPHHWVAVTLVLAALLLVLSEAHGQVATGSSAVFAGRPAIAGAQGGLGAQAGMPQGGIGVQGNETISRDLVRKLRGKDEMPQGEPATDIVAKANTDMLMRPDVKPGHDSSLAKDERSSVKKAKRAAKRVVKQTRTGVGEFDTALRN